MTLGACGIAIMAKASKAGLTKTRLAPCVGFDQAARLNTAFLRDAAANVVRAADIASLRGYMAYGPPGDGGFFDFLPQDFGLIEAWQADFGATLKQAFMGVLAQGHAVACLLNADSPSLPPSIIADAAQRLMEPGDRLVLGPSTDGGYYLIGAKRLVPELFEDIPWSTDQVFERTIARAASLGLAVSLLPTWYDVDDATSLNVLRAELLDGTAFGDSGLVRGEAHYTKALLTSGSEVLQLQADVA